MTITEPEQPQADSALNARAAAAFIRGVYVFTCPADDGAYWKYARNDYKAVYNLLFRRGEAVMCSCPDSHDNTNLCKHRVGLTWKINETEEYVEAMKVVRYVSEAVGRGKVLHVAKVVRSHNTKMKEEAK